MMSQSADVAQRAKEIYAARLCGELEQTHQDAFVAIEPDSGDYFVGQSLSEAIQASRNKYPDRLTFALRIGHDAAINLGAMRP